MTDTNITDTNYHHDGGGVPQGCGKRMRVLTTQKAMVKDRRRAAVVGGVCGFVVCCAVSGATPGVVLCWVCWW